jgi:hypothetical protein
VPRAVDTRRRCRFNVRTRVIILRRTFGGASSGGVWGEGDGKGARKDGGGERVGARSSVIATMAARRAYGGRTWKFKLALLNAKRPPLPPLCLFDSVRRDCTHKAGFDLE